VKNRLLVRNLPFSVTPPEVRSFFTGLGHEVETIELGPNEKWRLPRGYAVVTLAHGMDPHKVMKETDGRDFEGRVISVDGVRPLKGRYRSERVA
jgi:RNA recognition motif-containing protein